MRIALAQTRPVTGSIVANVEKHAMLIDLVAAHGADLVVFPELSLTGYEPSLAGKLAVAVDDERLAVFQQLCDSHQLAIGVGVPTRSGTKPRITLLLFRPGEERLVYSKQHLHEDELPFFAPGEAASNLMWQEPKIALAICYEISVSAHAEAAVQNGADVYLASVAKTAGGVAKASERLAEVARTHSMQVLMANSVDMCEDGECAGTSSAWTSRGELAGQLDDSNEGLLFFNTESGKTVQVVLRT